MTLSYKTRNFTTQHGTVRYGMEQLVKKTNSFLNTNRQGTIEKLYRLVNRVPMKNKI